MVALAHESPAGLLSPPPSAGPDGELTIGVLALQGAFHEHEVHLLRVSGAPVPAVLLQAGSHSASSSSKRSNGTTASISQSASASAPAKPLPTLRTQMVRSLEELSRCHGLIIPGGESTAISLGAQRAGLLEPLREWVRQDRPTWGTCAGMIMLADQASGGKRGGQELLGGLDVRVGRNGFGSQVDSFELDLEMPILSYGAGGASSSSVESASPAIPPFTGIFIRAPIVDRLFPRGGAEDESGGGVDADTVHSPTVLKSPGVYGPALPLSFAPPPRMNLEQGGAEEGQHPLRRAPLQILATLPCLPPNHIPLRPPRADSEVEDGDASALLKQTGPSPSSIPRPPYDSQIVAVRQGNLVATSFHPELTRDGRLHEWWCREVVVPFVARGS